jgi:RNA polymerase sigma-70 factor (ECF subfamily)
MRGPGAAAMLRIHVGGAQEVVTNPGPLPAPFAVLRRKPSARALEAMSDPDLMALVQAGQVKAFEVMFDRHCSVAYSLAYRVCRRQATAEEVVQEAFLSLWRSRARYDPARGTVRSWVLRVVHNRAIDALRRAPAPATELSAEHEPPGSDDTEGTVLDRDGARAVRDALRALPDEQRQAIELAFFGGLTHGEIAVRLGLPAGTVKGRIRLGMQKLRAALEPSLSHV